MIPFIDYSNNPMKIELNIILPKDVIILGYNGIEYPSINQNNYLYNNVELGLIDVNQIYSY